MAAEGFVIEINIYLQDIINNEEVNPMFSLYVILFLTVPPVHGAYCATNNPDFDEYRYEEQIPHCTRNVTTEEKIKICKRDGVTDRSDFTVDHIIPLALGGSNDESNLWCQHKSIAVTPLEYQSYLSLSQGKMTQEEAVSKVLTAKFHPIARVKSVQAP